MPLTVEVTRIGKKLHRLQVFDGNTWIGDYERAQEADIARKEQEIRNSEAQLRNIFRQHGTPFIVRWNHAKRKKSVRVGGVEVGNPEKGLGKGIMGEMTGLRQHFCRTRMK